MRAFLILVLMSVAGTAAIAQDKICLQVTAFYNSGKAKNVVACFYPRVPRKTGEEAEVVIKDKSDIEVASFKMQVVSVDESWWSGGNTCIGIDYPHTIYSILSLQLTDISRLEKSISCNRKSTWDFSSLFL